MNRQTLSLFYYWIYYLEIIVCKSKHNISKFFDNFVKNLFNIRKKLEFLIK